MERRGVGLERVVDRSIDRLTIARTRNLLERLNKEMKRRTQVATLFPNEASLLRLITAVLTEDSDDCETGRKYLTITP
jgi:transposase-like protein